MLLVATFWGFFFVCLFFGYHLFFDNVVNFDDLPPQRDF